MATSLAWFVTPGAAASGSLFPLLMMLPIFLVMYLMMIRPQKKRQKQWQQMLANMKAGDRVTTAGGIRGVIFSIKDDVLVIRVAPDNLKLEVAKNAIAAVTPQDSSPES
ncbi:MAG: preprotein translocase subunit YajC [Terracidiphilus sp.]